MKKKLIIIIVVLVCKSLSVQTVSAQQEVLTIDVQNVSEPGLFTFNNPKGSVFVTGYKGEVILVTGTLRHPNPDKKNAGNMARLDDYPFNLTAEVRGGQVLLLCESNGKTVDFEIKIPRRFTVSIKSGDNGELRIVQVEGNVDAENPNGNVTILGISGSANLSSVNGNIIADFKEIGLTGSITITTLEGNIGLTVPENSKMNFKLKSAQKEIRTDLEIERGHRNSMIKQSKDKKVYTLDDWTYGTLNGGGSGCILSTCNGTIEIKKR